MNVEELREELDGRAAAVTVLAYDINAGTYLELDTVVFYPLLIGGGAVVLELGGPRDVEDE